MKNIAFLMLLLCSTAFGQTITGKKIFEYPNQPAPTGTYLFLMDSGHGTYYNIALPQLLALGTNTGTIIISNASFNYITNINLYSSNIYATNITVEMITDVTNVSFVSYVTNLYSSNIFSTNITVENITNNNFFSTNVTIQNLTSVTNNLTFITNYNLITTNITINQPGGATNLNLTPLSLMYSDVNDAEASLPNGTGVLTNNGTGGIGWTLSFSLDEIDALNAYLTNFFTGLTNVATLGTDANGLLTLGSSTITNVSITNAFISLLTNNVFVNTNLFIITSNAFINNLTVTNLYAITNFSTNLYFVSGKGNTLIITNVGLYGNLTNNAGVASTVAFWGSDKVLTNVANTYGMLTNDGSGAVGFTSSHPQGDGAAITNLTYRYITNNTGSTTLNWGLAYRTNIAANVTLALQSVSASPNAQFYETIVYWATNSSATDWKTTWPSGVIGPVGSGTPSVLYCTNKTLTRILVEHYGPSDIVVSKTDFGN